MSCGNRFQCGLSKPSRFQFKPDKPSNQELHNENQKRLNELLKAREEIDKQFLSSTTKLSESSAITIHNPEVFENTTYEPWSQTQTADNNFTPWKVPSATDYQSKAK
jgi:hypothetical protein